MESPTPTPTLRKPPKYNKGSQRPEQRNTVPALQPDNEYDDGDASSEDELIVLLRVSKHELVTSNSSLLDLPDQPKKGGILAISKADILESNKKGRRGGKKVMGDGELERKPSQPDRKTPGKKGMKKAHPVDMGFDIESFADSASESAGTPTRKGRAPKMQAAPKPSGLASTLAAHKSTRPTAKVDNSDLAHFDTSAAKPYDMTILSRSLPGQHDNVFGGQEMQTRESKKEEKSDVWDMPVKSANEERNVSIPTSPITSSRFKDDAD